MGAIRHQDYRILWHKRETRDRLCKSLPSVCKLLHTTSNTHYSRLQRNTALYRATQLYKGYDGLQLIEAYESGDHFENGAKAGLWERDMAAAEKKAIVDSFSANPNIFNIGSFLYGNLRASKTGEVMTYLLGWGYTRYLRGKGTERAKANSGTSLVKAIIELGTMIEQARALEKDRPGRGPLLMKLLILSTSVLGLEKETVECLDEAEDILAQIDAWAPIPTYVGDAKGDGKGGVPVVVGGVAVVVGGDDDALAPSVLGGGVDDDGTGASKPLVPDPVPVPVWLTDEYWEGMTAANHFSLTHTPSGVEQWIRKNDELMMLMSAKLILWDPPYLGADKFW